MMQSESFSDTDDHEAHMQEEQLKSAITDRQIFTYSFWRVWCLKFFGSSCCLCCQVRRQRQDRLQESARRKLFSEIDILEIIKKLRVATFASEMALKPRQRWLVSFFHEYKLESDSDSDI